MKCQLCNASFIFDSQTNLLVKVLKNASTRIFQVVANQGRINEPTYGVTFSALLSIGNYGRDSLSQLTHWGREKMVAISRRQFKWIFLNENIWISIEVALKFVPKGPINNIPALVQIMAWRRPGDKPLSVPMMFSLLTHICVTRPQWVKH